MSSLGQTLRKLRVTLSVTKLVTTSRAFLVCSHMKRAHSTFNELPQSRVKRKMSAPKGKIQLTPRENQLRELLLDVARYIDESKEIKEKLELRFAGGWVRDKLLHIPSHDIDTAINSMTGEAFAQKMKEYLKIETNRKKHDMRKEDIKNIHHIEANPEKSKHLATATTNIFGFDVDFVNLRKETYSANSRNPQIEFGTAEEDALRRDATVNALFFNLHSEEVEDFTGGLADLNIARIKTPLEPKTTFMDDPLRVLRLIRFASRLNFSIYPETEAYMADPEVLKALKLKISRERVGIEIEKMLKGKTPIHSLELIDRLGLYSTIFTDPTVEGNPTPNTANWYIAYDSLDELKKNETPGSIYQSLVRSQDAQYLAWILAALVPWTTVPQTQSAKSKGKPSLPLGAMVAREGIKADNKICNVASGAFKQYKQIIKLKDDIIQKEPYTNERDIVGMTIRRWDSQGGSWRVQVMFALLVEAMDRKDLQSKRFPKCNTHANNSPGYPVYEKLWSEWQAFINHLEQMDLMDVANLKGIITGTELSKGLGGIKAGPWMKAALDVCMEWQLRNPGEKDTQGAIDEVKSRAKELNIPISK
jgi:tRNA nucleotidyltransferase (CCA-adding enzyme)